MNRNVLLAVVITGLAACGGPDGPVETTSSEDRPRVAEPAKVDPTPGQLRTPLPASAKIDFPYRLQYDREVDGSAGERRIAVEYLEGTQESVADLVNASLLEAGFKLGKRSLRANGSIRMTYRSKRYGRVFVVVEPESSADKGRVVYRWVPRDES